MSTPEEKHCIVHLIATNFYGGPEKQIIEHLRHLGGERYRPVLISFVEADSPNEILAKASEIGLEHYGIPMASALDWRPWRDLNRVLRRIRPSLLCTHGYKATIMAYPVCRRLAISALAFSRGYTSENLKVRFYGWLERRMLGKYDGVICVSDGQRRAIEKMGIRPRDVWVVHNCVSMETAGHVLHDLDVNEVRRQLGVGDNQLLVVVSGRLSPEKGHRHLLDAIAQLDGSQSSAVFAICGDGPLRKVLKRQAVSLGIADRCRFTGFRNDMQQILAAMDLLALPSLTEGLPNVVLEAFSYARPVVATAVGGVPEVIEDGINGMLVPPANPTALANALERCLADARWRDQLGQAGLEKVRNEFNFERQQSLLQEIYAKVLKA